MDAVLIQVQDTQIRGTGERVVLQVAEAIVVEQYCVEIVEIVEYARGYFRNVVESQVSDRR